MIDLNTYKSPVNKAMFYSHDTYGLGHLRRTLTLANHVRLSSPRMSQLIVTGSPSAQSFVLPDGTDYVKLPSVTKNKAGDYEARTLDSTFSDIRDMRSDILLSSAKHFQPDFFVVDHAPAGLDGEALDTLRFFRERHPDTKLIVGLRDIIDEAPKVRATWERDGIYDLLDDLYDLILVYGHRNMYDVVEEYGLSAKAADKTRFVGYLGREPGSQTPETVRASLDMVTDKLVVVSAGGGGDGRRMFDAVLRAVCDDGRPVTFDTLLIGGPLMSEEDRAGLRALLGARKHVHFLDFTDDMTSYLGAADLVISMGGYNTVCEILSVKTPAIIVPRVTPRKEQLIRAEMLQRRGFVHMIHPDVLTPAAVIDATTSILAESHGEPTAFVLDGLRNVVSALGSLMPNFRVGATSTSLAAVA